MKLRWVSDAPPWSGRAEAVVATELGFFSQAGIEEADIQIIPGERNAMEDLTSSGPYNTSANAR